LSDRAVGLTSHRIASHGWGQWYYHSSQRSEIVRSPCGVVRTRNRQIASPFGPKWHAVRTDFHEKSLNWSVLVFIRTSVIKSHRYIQVGFAQKSAVRARAKFRIRETYTQRKRRVGGTRWAYCVPCCDGHTVCITVVGILRVLMWWA